MARGAPPRQAESAGLRRKGICATLCRVYGRAKLVLLALVAAAREGRTLSIREIADLVRRPATTVLRDLRVLVREGYLVRVAYRRGFAPTHRGTHP